MEKSFIKISQNMSSSLAEYYLAKIPLIEKSLNFFPKNLNSKWSAIAFSANMPPGILKDASEILSEPVKLYLRRKGKMLRSLLSCLILEAKNKKIENFLPLVAMMEILESDTIMIDDIIDASPERRGGPSAHVARGIGPTMLAGGFFYYSSWHIFSRKFLPISEKAELKALRWFVKRHLLTSVGQTEEIYYRIKKIPLKMRRYFQEISSRISVLSFGGPLYLAGLAAGFSEKDIAALDKLGDFLGLAYHLRGDELNLFPDSGDWGKSRGDDIMSGTMTYLNYTALKNLRGKDKKFLKSSLGNADISERGLTKTINLIKKSGAVRKNRLAADYLRRKSERIINEINAPKKYKNLLCDILKYMAYDRKK